LDEGKVDLEIMKLTKIVGLCFVAVFALSLMAVSSASAVEWGLCSKVESGKFKDSLCLQPGTGAFEFKKLTAAVAVTGASEGKIKLEDMEATGGASLIECEGNQEGTVGPGVEDEVTKITATSCVIVSGSCENEATAKAVNLPWKTELAEEGGVVYDKIISGTGGEPGWKVECKVLGIFKVQDTCEGTAKTRSLDIHNGVLVHFEPPLQKPAKCSLSGKESGLVTGLVKIEGTSATSVLTLK